MPVPRRARLVERMAVGFALWGVGAGCAHPPPATPAGQERAAPTPLRRLFDRYYEDQLALDPVLATTLGDHRYDARLSNDLSADHRAQVAALCRRYLTELAAFAPASLSAGEGLSHELLRRELRDRAARKQKIVPGTSSIPGPPVVEPSHVLLGRPSRNPR